MSDLKLITNTLTYDDRIQARIDGFAREIMAGQGNMEYVRDILIACNAYLVEYEDADIFMSCYKIKEAVFYIDCFLES